MTYGIIAAAILVIGFVGAWIWHEHSKNSPQNASQSSTTQQQVEPSAGSTAAQGICPKLTLTMGNSEGTAGTTYWHAVITNNDSAACTLNGYPRALVNDTALVVEAKKNTVYQASSVTLAANGGKAYVLVGVPDPGNYSPGSVKCTVASRSNLFMYLPDRKAPVATQFRYATCEGFTVSAIHAGS